MCSQSSVKKRKSSFEKGQAGSPGYAALAMTGEGHKHPSQTPQYFAGQHDYDAPDPRGQSLTMPSYSIDGVYGGRTATSGGTQSAVDPGTYTGEHRYRSGAANIGGARQPRAEAIHAGAKEYGEQFAGKEGWYNDYLKKAYSDPVKGTVMPGGGGLGGEGAFTTLKEVIQQNAPAQLTNMDFSGMPGQAPSEWTGAGGAAGSPLIMKSGTGAMSDALSALDTAGADYYKEEDRLTSLKEDAKLARSDAKNKLSRERTAFLTGQLPESEQRDAAIAATNMAFSGPAQQRADIQAIGDKKTLGDIVLDERKMSKDYKDTMSDIGVEEEDMETAWTDATEAYGSDLKDLTGDASSNLQSIMDWVNTTLPQQHTDYGETLKGRQAPGDFTDEYKWRDVDRGFMPSSDRYLPQSYPNIGGYNPKAGGGYFSSTEALPMIPQARNITQSMRDFNNWLDTQGSAQVAQAFGLPNKPIRTDV